MTMQMAVQPIDAEHYATELSCTGNKLSWNAIGATHSMLVQSEYGNALQIDDAFMQALSDALDAYVQSMMNDTTTIELTVPMPQETVSVTLIPSEIMPVSVWAVAHRHRRYSVFACDLSLIRRSLIVYMPTPYMPYSCDVPLAVAASLTPRVPKKTGLFGAAPAPYSVVVVEPQPDYDGVGLCYECGGHRYPITKGMVGAAFAVPSLQIRLTSDDPGIAIV